MARKRIKPVDFMERTQRMWARARARTPKPEFTLAELRAAFKAKMDTRPLCQYCGVLLDLENVSLDHRRPLVNGGRNSLANIDFICMKDNDRKGKIDGALYAAFLAALDGLGKLHRAPGFKQWVLTALDTANSYRFAANRAAKAGR